MTDRKSSDKKFTLTDAKMMLSLRNGHHATVYEVRRDPQLKNKDVIRDRTKPVFPFVSGSLYKGQWNNDKKDGFGIQTNPDNTKYEGEWVNNQYHGRGTLWIKKGKTFVRQYVGDWVKGRMEGQGIYYYSNGEIYRGGWLQGKRCGSGKFEYNNGDVYSGEWANDLQHGLGTMNYANGNVYEGLWVEGKKQGPGLFYYASTRKLYQGEWLEDQPRCGEYRVPTVAEEARFDRPLPKGIFSNDFELPQLGLANPKSVIDSAISSTRLGSMQKDNYNTGLFEDEWQLSEEQLAAGKEKFYQLIESLGATDSLLPLANAIEVLNALNIFVDEVTMSEISNQLDEKGIRAISYADITEIALFLLQQASSAQQQELEGRYNEGYYESPLYHDHK